MDAAMRTPVLLSALLLCARQAPGQDFEAGFASITEKELLVHATELASPQLEGRDSPSEGLFRAGEYIIGRLTAAGVAPGMPDGTYRMGYTVDKEAPVPEECLLALVPDEGEELTFVLEEDFVPLPGCQGEAEGKLSFFGFGITESDEKRYDDLKGKNCKDEIVIILEGEPRSKRLFEGSEVTHASDVYSKVKALEKRGARGVLVVRRPPEGESKGLDGKLVVPVPLGFRHSWASWVGEGQRTEGSAPRIPAHEITAAVATTLLGEDVLRLAAQIESSGKPVRRERKDVRVSLRAGTTRRPVPIDNIVGLVRGSDPALANEYLVMGAHYDHIGVDTWGRIGCGADDNGSGSSGLLEQAEALAIAKPRRSVLVCWFSSEEDGLDGSRAFCERPPVALGSLVGMLNVDMIGRLAEDEVYVIGAHVNRAYEDVLKDAKKLKPTQIKKVFTDKGLDLWTRSDHYNFQEKGVPAMFFTEGAIDSENVDYHRWTDTVDKLSLTKMARISRFMFNTAWLIANAPERPPAPE
jgi:hypothetical protein